MYKEKLCNLIDSNNIEEAIAFLENFCKDFPENLDAKLDCSLLLTNTFIYADGYVSAYDLVNEILSRDENNLKALLIKGYIEDAKIGQIKEETLLQIDKKIQQNRNETYSEQLYLLRALYFYHKKDKSYMDALKQSILYDPFSSYNYLLLSKKLKEIGELSEGEKNVGKAITNIIKIYDDMEPYNPINFTEFINEKFKGICITKTNYDSIIELKDSLKNL
jgi:uncharacterized protein HemY